MDDPTKKLSGNCSSSGVLMAFLETKARNHNHFKYYSKKEYIESILDNNAVYLSDGSRWNDRFDRDRFNMSESPVRKFGLCFSFMKSENVASWMLYGGRGKEGAMIDFSRKSIGTLLSCTTIDVGHFDSGKFIVEQVLTLPQFSIRIVDVLYYALQDNGKYTVKRSDEVVKDLNASIASHMVKTYGAVVKSFPWNYECECRLIVEIDKKAVGGIDLNGKMIRLSFGGFEVKNELKDRVYQAPNCTGTIGRFKKSNLSGEIDWDLCEGCAYLPSTK